MSQFLQELLPILEEYFPGSHMKQFVAPLELDIPLGQSLHEDEGGTLPNVPVGHGSELEQTSISSFVQLVMCHPCEISIAIDPPATDMKPGSTFIQFVPPTELIIQPMGQLSQVSLRLLV